MDVDDLTITQIARMLGVKSKQVRAVMQLSPEQRAALTSGGGSTTSPSQQRSNRRHRRQGRRRSDVGGDRPRHVAEVDTERKRRSYAVAAE